MYIPHVHSTASLQERFQVKNPPAAYIQKLKSYLETGGVSRKVAADWMPNLGVFVPLSLCSFPPHFASTGAAGETVRVNSSAGLCGYTDEGVYTGDCKCPGCALLCVPLQFLFVL